jgi:hypothetical protein
MRMDLAGYVINAVLVEGRSVKEVCEAHEISRSWLYELIARYRELGEEGLKPQSKRPHSSPMRVAASIEDEIVALRMQLTASCWPSSPSTRPRPTNPSNGPDNPPRLSGMSRDTRPGCLATQHSGGSGIR